MTGLSNCFSQNGQYRRAVNVIPTWVFQFAAESGAMILNNFWINGLSGNYVDIDFGDGSSLQRIYLTTGQNNVTHTYGIAGLYTVTMYMPNNAVRTISMSGKKVYFNLASLPTNLTRLDCVNMNYITGNIDALPSTITYLYIWYCSQISGSINYFSNGMTDLRIGYCATTFTGNIANLPSTLTMLSLSTLGTGVVGSIDNLTSTLGYLSLVSMNQLTGDIGNLSRTMTFLDFFATGEYVTGNINTLPPLLTSLRLQGNIMNIVGNLQDTPAGVTSLTYAGCGNIVGSIDYFTSALKTINFTSLGNITGSIANLPSGLTQLLLQGNYSLTFNINELPVTMSWMRISGLPAHYHASYTSWSGFAYIYLNYTSLVQAEIDGILHDILLSGYVGNTIDLRNNVAPSSAGYADKAALIAAGWVTVLTD